jgi:serine/threonine-protein kinase
MHEDFEAELRMALAEGLITREEVEPLREESLRSGKGPMELLKARGLISDESLADLRKADVEETFVPRAAATGGAETLGPALTLADRDKVDPAFPVPGWERYEGVRFLGQGGMGRVFLAYDRSLRRNVALKFVRGDDELLVRRLMSEARAQARVEHERVCQVHEVGEVQGKPYIAMQFVDGLPLDRLASELKLTVEQKVLVLREASEGVHAAHRAGLIHRDLKPSNILVERTDDGRLKPFVMDFGLAHDWSEKGSISSGSAVGTPHYMAPEQARGEVEGLDRRADVYSLGATLYFLLTGHQAIPGDNGLEVLNNIATVEPSPPRALDPNVPTDLEAIVLKCLEKDRSARYDSARALIEDLDRFLAGEPVQARSTGRWYRLRKKAAKHRLVVSVATAALLAVTLALGSALYTHSQATRRERLARSFTEKVEHIEALARYSGLSPLHDTREDREKIRVRMAELEGQIREAGALAVGPGHYALARGHLALGDEASARTHLEQAWQNGFTDPRVAYALALVLGHQYQDQLLEAERQRSIEERRRDIQARYRDPALDWLRRSQGADVHSSEYVSALIAFYEDDFDGALARLDAMGNRLPWFYEAPQLRGDILQARAARRWNLNQGDLKGARADFEAGRRAYAAAAAIGESVPAVHQALAKLEYTEMTMEFYSSGDVLPSFTRGMEAVTRALQAAPEDPAALMLKARFHRRLADFQNNRSKDSQASIEKALIAARTALQHGQPAWDVQLELGRIFLQQARSQYNRRQDPFESLRQAEQALQAIDVKDWDYEFHTARGSILSLWATYEDDTHTSSEAHRNQAIEALREAIRLDPRMPDAWINLGRAYFKRAWVSADAAAGQATPGSRLRQEEDLKEAWEANRRALELNPKYWVPYYYGGEVNEQRADRRKCAEDALSLWAKALELYQQGLAIDPKSHHLLSGVGKALLGQAQEVWRRGGDPLPVLKEAEGAFEQALVLASKANAHNNLGMVHSLRALYQESRGEDPTASARAAESAFEKAFQLAPDDLLLRTNLSQVLHTLAESELRRGKDPSSVLQRSEKGLREALAHNPQNAEAWGFLGETLALQLRWKVLRGQARQEDFEEAAKNFEQSLKLAPDLHDTRVAAASLHHTWGLWEKEAGRVPAPQLERGLALVEEVLKSCPKHPEALLLRAKWMNPGGLQSPR